MISVSRNTLFNNTSFFKNIVNSKNVVIDNSSIFPNVLYAFDYDGVDYPDTDIISVHITFINQKIYNKICDHLGYNCRGEPLDENASKMLQSFIHYAYSEDTFKEFIDNHIAPFSKEKYLHIDLDNNYGEAVSYAIDFSKECIQCKVLNGWYQI